MERKILSLCRSGSSTWLADRSMSSPLRSIWQLTQAASGNSRFSFLLSVEAGTGSITMPERESAPDARVPGGARWGGGFRGNRAGFPRKVNRAAQGRRVSGVPGARGLVTRKSRRKLTLAARARVQNQIRNGASSVEGGRTPRRREVDELSGSDCRP